MNLNFNLYDALNRYTPFDKEEKKHVTKVKKFVAKRNNLFDRSNLEGHITGSGFLFSADLKRILLTRHAFLKKWLMFGGHSDGEENTLNVAIREIQEESGIFEFKPISKDIFNINTQIFPCNEKKHEPAHYHYDIAFAFITNENEYIISDESVDVKWFTLEELKKLDDAFHEKDRIIKKWEGLIKIKEKTSIL